MEVARARLAFSSVIMLFLAFLAWRHSSSPPLTHYQVLEVQRDASAEEIDYAYHKKLAAIKSSRNNGKVAHFSNYLQVQHAFEILSDPLRRRDYDNFEQDELQDHVRDLQKQGEALDFQIHTLWEPFKYYPDLSGLDVHFSADNLNFLQDRNETLLIQIYSIASRNCWKHETDWKHLCEQIEGVVNIGRVELGEVKLASYFASKNWATGRKLFRYGLPAYIAIPPDCKSDKCIVRYRGILTIDGLLKWITTDILNLPQIMYYSPETLITQFIKRSGPHKIKVVIFSTTGERANLHFRKAARDYWEYFSFSLVLWQETDARLWENRFGVRSAPAMVLLRDPGLAPIIFYGKPNASMLVNLLEENKLHVLPQLRSITAQELGCTESGYSVAGKTEQTWYCTIVSGRPGLELSRARAVMRDVKNNLTTEDLMHNNGPDSLSTAALAVKTKRMVLAWLDGAFQKQICLFYLNSPTVHDTCGEKAFPEQIDVPRVFMVRYRRHPKDQERILAKKSQGNSFFNQLLREREDLASQIVAVYTEELIIEKLISWISKMIEEGDREDSLVYIKKAPSLIPEEQRSGWPGYPQRNVVHIMQGFADSCKDLGIVVEDFIKEPRFMYTVAILLASLCVLLFTSKR
ncbi:hypothetical protein KP509_29G086000 [Ceratopteris richardii]|uniref:J domain-containing protein n=1 Tax=Ceratopteris richardii TaxID=49495 RepID=A0A8T2RBB5_CERRI|nr:hypothetical protein KP509_29G086000 [Ceratopteris richardii]